MARSKTTSTTSTHAYTGGNSQGGTSCSGCPQFSTPSSSSMPSLAPDFARELLDGYSKIKDLQKELEKIKEGQEKKNSFYNELTKLSKVSRVAILLLMIVPVLQLIMCTIVVYALGIQEQLPSLLNWLIGGISFISVVELVVGGIKLYMMEQKMDEIKEKIETIKEEKETHGN